MFNKILRLLLVVAVAVAATSQARADTFGTGVNSFDIEFVPIGDPGNPPDTTDRPVTDGAVAYRYRMGKFEISEQMIDKANASGGLNLTHDGRGANFPATSISWFEAAKFVNWLNIDAGYSVAYKFDGGGNFQLWESSDPGFDPNNLYRNRRAHYFLPSLSEWHKAAYYDPLAATYYDYPTGSDTIPDGIDFVGDSLFDAVFNDGAFNPEPNNILNVGVFSPYGTAGQAGNVREWIETAFDRVSNETNEHRRLRGGSWGDSHTLMDASNGLIGFTPEFLGSFVGFRVASIPEPSTIALTAGMIITACLYRKSKYKRV